MWHDHLKVKTTITPNDLPLRTWLARYLACRKACWNDKQQLQETQLATKWKKHQFHTKCSTDLSTTSWNVHIDNTAVWTLRPTERTAIMQYRLPTYTTRSSRHMHIKQSICTTNYRSTKWETKLQGALITKKEHDLKALIVYTTTFWFLLISKLFSKVTPG